MGQKYCFYMFASHKYIDKCKSVEQTWGKEVEYFYFFTDREEKNEHYIKCTDQDDYASHMIKNFYAIQYAYDNMMDKVDWHVFIGEDNFYFIDNFEKLLETLDTGEKKIYGNCNRGNYVCGGGGIIFNNTSLQAFVEGNKKSQKELDAYGSGSDIVISAICDECGIERTHISTMFSERPEYYENTNPEEYVCFHKIRSNKEFKSLYRRYILRQEQKKLGEQTHQPPYKFIHKKADSYIYLLRYNRRQAKIIAKDLFYTNKLTTKLAKIKNRIVEKV